MTNQLTTDKAPLTLSKRMVLPARRNTLVLRFTGSFEPLWNENKEEKEKVNYYIVFSSLVWIEVFTHQRDLHILSSQLVFLDDGGHHVAQSLARLRNEVNRSS